MIKSNAGTAQATRPALATHVKVTRPQDARRPSPLPSSRRLSQGRPTRMARSAKTLTLSVSDQKIGAGVSGGWWQGEGVWVSG